MRRQRIFLLLALAAGPAQGQNEGRHLAPVVVSGTVTDEASKAA